MSRGELRAKRRKLTLNGPEREAALLAESRKLTLNARQRSQELLGGVAMTLTLADGSGDRLSAGGLLAVLESIYFYVLKAKRRKLTLTAEEE